MELLIAGLVAVLVWGPPLALVAIVAGVLGLRIRRLEHRVRELGPTPRVREVLDTPEPIAETAAPPTPRKVMPLRPPRPPIAWPSPERVVVWVAASLGGVALLLTALFALVTVVERGWLGPVARVSAGLVSGTAAWIGGTLLRRRWPWVGQAVSGAGIGALYGALYAGASLYDLLLPSIASGAMIAVTAVGTARAAVDRDRFVAWLTLIGGLLTPWLVSTGENRPLALFGYLAVLAVGVVCAAAWRGWADLVVGAAIGVAALHVGWTLRWYSADQVSAALAGAALLQVPFALVAMSSRRSIRIVATVAVAVVALLAAPWVVPVEVAFFDPRSHLVTFRDEPLAQPFAAIAVGWLPLPLVLLGRWHDRRLQASVALIPAAVLGWLFAAGWGTSDAATAWAVVGVVGGVAAASVVALRSVETATGIVPWLLITGLALCAIVGSPAWDVFGLGVVGLVGAATALAVASRWGGTAAVGLLGVSLPLWVASVPPDAGGPVIPPPGPLGPALVVLAVAVVGGVRLRWATQAQVGWIAAAAAPIAVFPPLYDAWTRALGDSALGLLPLLLGAVALLGAGVLQRRQLLLPNDVVTAAFTGAVLLGVTAAVPLQLGGRWLTVAWALEAAALAWVSHRIRHELVRVASLVLCAIVGVRLLVNPWAFGWGDASEGWVILNWTLYTWGVPGIALLCVARWLPRHATDPIRVFVGPLVLLATFVGFALVNAEVSHTFQDQGALTLASADRLQSMTRSASWAAYGLAVLGIGLWRDHRVVRLVGFAFVMLATLKVFAFDLWGLSGFVRVGSIGCLAVSLILAALAFERLVLRGVRTREA